MKYEHIIKQANRRLDQADWLIAIAVIGALIAFTPLYASAALATAHQRVERVPVLTPMSAAVLTRALTPVHDKRLHPVTMRLPPTLPRGRHDR